MTEAEHLKASWDLQQQQMPNFTLIRPKASAVIICHALGFLVPRTLALPKRPVIEETAQFTADQWNIFHSKRIQNARGFK